MPESGAGELAWETTDRLFFAVCPQRFSAPKSCENDPEPELHARGGPNSAGVANADVKLVA